MWIYLLLFVFRKVNQNFLVKNLKVVFQKSFYRLWSQVTGRKKVSNWRLPTWLRTAFVKVNSVLIVLISPHLLQATKLSQFLVGLVLRFWLKTDETTP